MWSGDAITASAPRTAIGTFMRLIEADANLSRATLTSVGLTVPAGFPLLPGPSASSDTVTRPQTTDECRPHYPAEAWTVQGSWVETVLLFPTTAEREAVDKDFLASGYIGTSTTGGSCQVISDGFFITTWVAVDNVMVGVEVPSASSAPWVRPDAVLAALTR